MSVALVTTITTTGGQDVKIYKKAPVQEMRYSVRSGNPYRDASGKFGTGGTGQGEQQDPADKAIAAHAATAMDQTSLAKQKKYNKELEQLRSDFAKRNGLEKQLAASDALMEDWVIDSDSTMSAMEDANKSALLGELDGAMAFEYQFSQAYFKAAGLETLPLYRGVTGKAAGAIRKQIDSTGSAALRSDFATSWSDAESIASRFASDHSDNNGLYFKVNMPTSRVTSTWMTNPRLNSFGENEFIVTHPYSFTVSETEVEYAS